MTSKLVLFLIPIVILAFGKGVPVVVIGCSMTTLNGFYDLSALSKPTYFPPSI